MLDRDAEAALELSQQLRSTAESAGEPAALIDALKVLTRAQHATGRSDQALATGETALRLAQSLGDDPRQSDVHRRLTAIYIDRNDYANAERHLRSALTLAENAGDELRLAHGFSLLAKIRRYQVRYDESLEHIDAALAIYQRIENDVGVARQVAFRGVVLELMGQFEPALEAHMQALKLAQQRNDLSGSASALYNLGEIHRELGDFDLSLSYLMDALALDQRVGNQTDIAYSHNMVGQAYLETGDFALARDHAQQAVRLFDQLKAPRDGAWARTVLARVELAMGHLPEARRLLDVALATAVQRESWSLLPIVRMQRVRLELAAGQFAEAQHQALLGIEMTRGNGESDREEELTGLLSQAKEAAGDYPGAIEALRRQQALKSEILRKDRQQTMAAMQSQAEFLRRGQRIELLEASQALQEERMSREALTRKVWIGAILGLFVLIGLSYTRWTQQRLNQRLRAEVKHRTSELESAYAAVEEASLTDALTGLRNRRFLEQREPGERASTNGLLVLLLDLDYFKNINDTHGHDAGDSVLMQIAARLREEIADDSALVRWGGEEFLVVCGSTDAGAALAERLRQSVASKLFPNDGGGALRATCSAGFVELPPDCAALNALRWPNLISLADRCLYAAKAGGRNAWVGLRATQVDGSTIQSELRLPLDDLLALEHWQLQTSLSQTAAAQPTTPADRALDLQADSGFT
ncbi:MAG: diguanylate cyclase [Pseudomonadota bacterium]